MAKKRKQARKSDRRASRTPAQPSRRRPSSSASQAATPELLSWALQGLQQEIEATRNRLAALEAQARSIRSTSRAQSVPAAEADSAEDSSGENETTAPGRKGSRRRKRKLSAEARARIADAQKRRWEAYREAKKK